MTAPVAPAPSITPATSAAPESGASSEPEYDGTRDSVRAMVRHQGDVSRGDSALAALAGKDAATISLAELRTLPGAAGLDDATLQQMWDEARGTPKADANAPAAKTPTNAVARAYKIFVGDAEVTDLSKITLEDVLSGKAQVEYQANNKAQRKTWDETIRNAKLGHYNAERTTQLTTERNDAFQRARDLQAQSETQAGQIRAVAKAFDAALRNDFAPLQKIIEEYNEALGAEPTASASDPNAETAQHEATGRQVYDGYVMPEATKLAQRFGLDAAKIAEAIMYKVQSEPPESATPARLQQIVEVEMPMHLEDYARDNPVQADPRDTKIAELTAALAKSQGGAADTHNSHVAAVHARRAASPPAAPSLPAHSGASDDPSLESVEDAKEWMKRKRGM